MLSDDKKRALYDQYGEAGVKSAVGGQAGSYTVLLVIEHHLFCSVILSKESDDRLNTLEHRG